MKRKTTLLQIVITLIFVLAFIFPTKATIWEIQVSNFVFTPDNLTDVMVGDTINWVWIEGSHTTTSADIPAGAAAWDELITSSNTEYSYVATVAGTYDYVCTPHASFGMVGSFTVQTVDGISSQNSPVITIAPNPVQDQLNVSMSKLAGHDYETVKVFNLNGQLVLEHKFGFANNSLALNVAILEQGVYLVEVEERNGLIIQQKIIKK